MGGTGLEPVTPSLSIRGNVRARSPRCAQTAQLRGIRPATEHLSERERTLILAILATRFPLHELVIGTARRSKATLDPAIATTLPP
jgi:hypothetical protein